MPNVKMIKLPGWWRWNKYAAWNEDDFGTRRGKIHLGHTSVDAVDGVVQGLADEKAGS